MLSPDEKAIRNFSLYRGLFIFSALYGALHKLIIPILLRQTSVLVRDYTTLDAWAIPGLLLAAYLLKVKRFDFWASLLAGMILLYAAWDAQAILSGAHKGWLAWSHAISSFPLAAMALVLLSTQQKHRSLKAAWIGAALGLGILLSFSEKAFITRSTPKPSAPSLVFSEAQTCGAQEFELELTKIPPSPVISQKSCGFQPIALTHSPGDKIFMERENFSPTNIHFVFFSAHGERRRQTNRLLITNSKRVALPELQFAPGEVAAILYSDTLPAMGKVLIVNAQAKSGIYSAGVTPERSLIWRPLP